MHGTHDEHCGCGCGGHGHDHHHDHEGCCGGHGHDHDHEGCCGGHGHDHDHEGCCGGHGHDHHEGCCCGGHDMPDENVAILTYMLDHNKHHALELKEIAAHLRAVGKEEAAAQIEKGVEDFEKGNMRLGIALSLVK